MWETINTIPVGDGVFPEKTRPQLYFNLSPMKLLDFQVQLSAK